jgi:hypothetical protein
MTYKSEKLFSAYVLIAVGTLITVLCGGCTVLSLGILIWGFITAILQQNPGANQAGDLIRAVPSLAIPIVVGGLPTAVGVMMILSGRRLMRRANTPPRRGFDSTFS